ncbi:hypothetical protein CYMTET_51371 [Cymbomonas tetramitiformis]|uniref:Uncharacterized protein n=1 Tax=Cymbomonas tetramitiformis TaxID=36881 RepID=A0AAE0ESF0_9CHLO|nr:hypothetical protein CYMTET_51371 [Cymbomonas tetramitiformis]
MDYDAWLASTNVHMIDDATPSCSRTPSAAGLAQAMQAARATTDLCRAQLRQLHKRMGHRDYAEIRVFPYSSQYKYYEQFSTSRRDYMIRVGYVLVGITGVTFIFMGMRTTWVVVGLVSLVHLELFGLIHYLGLQLNAISIIMLIATFGIADEYIDHIMYAYVLASGSPGTRVATALSHYIWPISSAAGSSVLGVVLLGWASAPILSDYFFRIFIVAIALSWLHGVILLPVLLLLAGRVQDISKCLYGSVRRTSV